MLHRKTARSPISLGAKSLSEMPAQARLRRTCARRANFRRSSSVARPQNFALVCFCPLLYYSQNLGTTVIQKSFLIPASLMMRLHSLSRDSLRSILLLQRRLWNLVPRAFAAFFLASACVLKYMATVDYGRYTAAWLYGQTLVKPSFPLLCTTGNLSKLHFLH